ncbi:MAG: T9SS type A sorting domain-containing protein [Ignavibacteriales bacterium]|nr:T9SS type A sorting domain-containing protein [Ignavibacteriales bacterium]
MNRQLPIFRSDFFKFLFSTLVFLSVLSTTTLAIDRVAVRSGEWSDPTIWTPTGVPRDTDNVIILDSSGSPLFITIENTNANCASILLDSNDVGSILDIRNLKVLTVSGRVLARGFIRTESGSTINVGGDWIINGDFIADFGSTVRFFGSESQTLAGADTFANFVVNKLSDTVTLTSGDFLVKNNWIDSSGVVNFGDFKMNNTSGSGTLILSAVATIKVGGNNSFPSGYSSYNLDSSSSVEFSGGAQPIHNRNYGNLILSGSGNKTTQEAIVVRGNLTIGTGTVLIGGSSRTHRIGGNWINHGRYTTGANNAVEFYGSGTQTIGGDSTTQFRILRINKPTNSIALLSNNISINLTGAKILVTSGTFDISTFTANRTTLSDSFVVQGSAKFRLEGTNNFPQNYSTVVFSPSSTCEYYSSGNQLISARNYGNLQLNGNGVKTGNGTFQVSGALAIGSGVTFNDSSFAVTLSGNLEVASDGFFNGSDSTLFNGTTTFIGNGSRSFHTVILSGILIDSGKSFTVTGNWYNSNTYNATGSVVFNGSSTQSISGGNFHNITFNGTQNKIFTDITNVSGNWSNLGSGIVSSNQIIVFNGSSKQTVNNGTSQFGNVTVDKTDTLLAAGNLTFSASLNLSDGIFSDGGYEIHLLGNFSNESQYYGTGGIFFDGTTVLSGGGGYNFRNVSITNSLNDGGESIFVRGNWDLSGTYTASGTVTFSGTSTQSIDGSNFYNIALTNSGQKNVLGLLTVTKNWTNTSSNFNFAGSTIEFNGTTTQLIGSSNFDSIKFSSSGLKIITGNISLKKLTIGSGAKLNGGNSNISIAREWINNGIFYDSTSTLTLTKNGTMTLAGDSMTSVYNLIVSDSTLLEIQNGRTLLLNGTLTERGYVSGVIEQTKNINTPNNEYNFGNIGAKLSSSGSVHPGVTTIRRTTGVLANGFDSSQVIKRIYIIRAENDSNLNLTLTLAYNENQERNSQVESDLRLWRAEENSPVWERINSLPNPDSNLVRAVNVQRLSQWTFSSTRVRRFVKSVGNWNVDTNWNPLGIPTLADSVLIIAGRECIIPENYEAFVGSINIEGTLTITQDETLNVAGDWVRSGTFNGNSSLIRFVGTNQSVAVSDFHHISFTDGGTTTLLGSMSISGNVSISSGDTVTGGTHNFSVLGNWSNSGVFSSSGNSTLTFNRNAAQEVSSSQFTNVTFAGSGTKTVSGNLNIGGDLEVGANVTVNASASLSVADDVTINSGGAFNGGSQTHFVGGDWTINGTFIPSGSTIVFNNSGNQTIAASKFSNVTFRGNGTKTIGTFSALGNVILDSGIVLNSGSTVDSIGGNFINNGTLQSTGTMVMYGDGKYLGGNDTTVFSTLVIRGAIIDTSNITITDRLSVLGSAGFIQTKGIVRFTGNTTLGGSAELNSVYIQPGNTLTLDANSSLSVSDSLYVGGTLDLLTNNPTNIEFTGTRNQTIPAISYRSLGVFNGFTKYAKGDITVKGDFTIDTLTTFDDNSFSITHNAQNGIVNNRGTYSGNGTYNIQSSSSLSGGGVYNFKNFTVDNGVTVSMGSLDIFIRGDYINNGGLSSTGRFIFNGTNQSITGTQFYNVYISGTGTKSFTNSTEVLGSVEIESTAIFNGSTFNHKVKRNWINRGEYISAGSSTVTFSGDSAQTISGSKFRNLVFGGSGTKIASGNLTVDSSLFIDVGVEFNAGNFSHSVAGNWTTLGEFTSLGSTIIFDGTGNQTIAASSLENVVIRGGGSKNTTIGLTVTGNLTVESGGLFNPSNSITISGDLTIDSNGIFLGGGFTHTLKGNIDNFGSFNPQSSTLNFTKNGTSTLTGNLSVNNIVISSSTVLIVSSGDTLTLSGALTENGYISGLIARTEALTIAGSYSFGNIGATINYTGSIHPGATTIYRHTGSVPPGFGATEAVKRYYFVNPAFDSVVNASVRFSYDDRNISSNELNNQTEAQLTLWEGNSSTNEWLNQIASTVDAANNFVSLTGLTHFSNWAISSQKIKTFTAFSGSWNDPQNWSPKSLPINIDSVVIPSLRTAIIDSVTMVSTKGLYIAGTLEAKYGSTLKVYGEWNRSGGTYNAEPSTVEFLGGNQTISSTTFSSVVLSGTSSKTLTGAVTVTGSFRINSGVTVVAGNGLSHRISGDWVNNGLHNSQTSTFTFDKTGTASFNGNTTFYNLTISVQTQLEVQNNDTVSIASGGTLTESGYFKGIIRASQDVSSVGQDYHFSSIGASLNFTGIPPGLTTVTRISGISPQGFSSSNVVRRYYIISSQTNPSNATLTLRYNASQELQGLDASLLKLWRSLNNGTSWGIEQSSTVNTLTSALSIESLTEFSTWAISASNVRTFNTTAGNWNSDANWLPTGIPTSLDSVYIPSAMSVTIPSSYAASARSLYLAGTLSMSTGTLSILRSWNKDSLATFSAGTGTVIFNGGNQNISSSNFANISFAGTAFSTKTIFGNVTAFGSIAISNVTLQAGTYSVSVNRNWTNDGVFLSSGTVSFSGSDSQRVTRGRFNDAVFSGTGRKFLSDKISFRNVTISSGATVEVQTSNDIDSVRGNWVNNGDFISLGTVIFNGTTEQHISQSSFNSIVFQNSGVKYADGNLSMSGSVTLSPNSKFVAGPYIHSVGVNWTKDISSEFTPTGSTIWFNGTSSQSISGSNFHHIRFSEVGSKTATGNLEIDSNVTIDAFSNFYGGNSDHTVGGNWNETGTFYTGIGSLIFTKQGTATFTATQGNSDVHRLIVRPSTMLAVTFGTTISIFDTLIEEGYVSGRIETRAVVNSPDYTYSFGGIGASIQIPSVEDSLGSVRIVRSSNTIPPGFAVTDAVKRRYEVYAEKKSAVALLQVKFNKAREGNSQNDSTLKLWSSISQGASWKRKPQSIFDSSSSMATITGLDSTVQWLAFSSSAGRKPSAGNVSWNDESVWSPGGIPTLADSVYVPLGTTLIIPQGVNVYVGDIHIAGTLQVPKQSTLHVYGDWYNTGTFFSDSGTVSFDSSEQKIDYANFYNLILKGNGVKSAVDSFTVKNDLVLNGVEFRDAGNNIRIEGDVYFENSNRQNKRVIPIYSGSGATIFNGVTKLNGDGDITLHNVFIYGTLDADDNDITLTGNWSASGTFTSLGTVSLNGNDSQYVFTNPTDTTHFYNLDINKVSGGVIQGSRIDVSNDFNLLAGYFDTRGNNLSVKKFFNLNDGIFKANSSTISVGRDWNRSGTFIRGTSTVSFFNTSNQPQSISSTQFHNLTLQESNTKTSNGALEIFGTFRMDNGRFIDDGDSIIVRGDISIASTATYDGTGLISFPSTSSFSGGGTFQFQDVNISGTLNGGNETILIRGNWANNGAFVSNGIVRFNGTNQMLSGSAFHSVEFTNGGMKTILGSLSVSGNFSIMNNTSVTAGNFSHLIQGNWDKASTGTFIPNNSLVHFNSVLPQTISSTTFHNLQFSLSGRKSATGALHIQGNFENLYPSEFSAGSFLHTFDSNWTNAGTLIPNTSTMVFTRNGEVLYNGGMDSLNNLEIKPQTTLHIIPPSKVVLKNSLIESGYLKGSIQKTENVNEPFLVYNFGNIGASMSYSSTPPGITTIERISGYYPAGFDTTTVVKRTYFIRTANISTDDSVRLSYNEVRELNNQDEPRLYLFSSPDTGKRWARLDNSFSNGLENYVGVGRVDTLQHITMSSHGLRLFVGTGTRDWSDSTVWEPKGIPTRSDSVYIPAGVSCVIPANFNGAICGDITIDGTLGFFGSDTLRVTGDWKRNGTFSRGTSTISFEGNNSQSITATDFYNFTVNGNGVKRALGDIRVDGSLDVRSGTFQDNGFNIFVRDYIIVQGEYNGTGTFIVDGSSTQLLGNGQIHFGNFNIPVAKVFTDNGKTFFVSKQWDNNGIYTATGIVNFNGTTSQTINRSNFYSVQFSNTGVKNVGGNLTARGNFVIESGANINAESFHIGVWGNWTNNGIFNRSGNGVDSLYGSGKKIDGSAAQITFNTLVIADSMYTTKNIRITNALNVIGSRNFKQASGTTIFDGTTSFAGKAHLVNVTVPNTRLLQLASNSLLHISGTLSGNIDATTNSCTIDFDGIGDQTVPSIIYDTLVVSNGGLKSKSTEEQNLFVNSLLIIESGTSFSENGDTVLIRGNVLNRGLYEGNGATVVANNRRNSKLFGENAYIYRFHHLNLRSSDTLTTGTLDVHITGNYVSTGKLVSQGNLIFDGNGGQTISAGSFSHLVIGGTGVVSLTDTIFVENSLTIQTGAVLHFGSGLKHRIFGNITNNGALNGGSSEIQFVGTSFTNNGNTLFNTSTFSLKGNGVQSISSQSLPRFFKLVHDNPFGTTLNSNIQVADTLLMLRGALITNTFQVQLDTSSWLVESNNGSIIVGAVKTKRALYKNVRNLLNGIGLEIFPTDTTVGLTDVTRRTGIKLSGIGNLPFSNSKTIARYFDIESAALINFQGTVTVHYNTLLDTIGYDESTFRVWTSTNGGTSSWNGYPDSSRAYIVDDSVVTTGVRINAPVTRLSLSDYSNPLQANTISLQSFRVPSRDVNNSTSRYGQRWNFSLHRGSPTGVTEIANVFDSTATAPNLLDSTYYLVQNDSSEWEHIAYRINNGDYTISSNSVFPVRVYGGVTKNLDFFNFHRNTMTVRMWLDDDSLLSTTSDRRLIPWTFTLASSSTLLDTTTDDWHLDRLVDGEYTLSAKDSVGWTIMGSIQNITDTLRDSTRRILSIENGSSYFIDFLVFPTQESYLTFTQDKWKTVPSKLANRKPANPLTQKKPTMGNITDTVFSKIFVKKKFIEREVNGRMAKKEIGLTLGLPLSEKLLKRDTLAYLHILHKGDNVRAFLGSGLTQTAKGFDNLQGEMRNPRFTSAWNNKLLGELLALKMNIAMSDARITPQRLGDVMYSSGTVLHPLLPSLVENKTLRQIALNTDSALTFWKERYSISDSSDTLFFTALSQTLGEINSAFDTTIFPSDFILNSIDSTYSPLVHNVKGRLLYKIPFLKKNVNITDTVALPLYSTPFTYRLYQNYPNPFNGRTIIQYDLPYDARVSFEVYNILGQKVATLFTNKLHTAGPDEVAIDISHLPSGIYFYQMTAKATEAANDTGEFVETKKFVLIK